MSRDALGYDEIDSPTLQENSIRKARHPMFKP